MTPPTHKHTTRPDRDGREICTSCHMVVTKPILSSDDPRLVEAGFMRSGHHDIDEPGGYPPLPELLVGLYFNAKAIGLSPAPKSWYVENTACFESIRSKNSIQFDELWDLLRGWHAKCETSSRSEKQA